MKSFYSILKFSPNIVTEDSLAIGIILFNKGSFHSFFSDKKKRIAQNLLNDKDSDLHFLMNQIKEKCEDIKGSNYQKILFDQYEKYSELSYFHYLSNYSNGILQFSKPNTLFENFDEKSFESLVFTLFNEYTESRKVESVKKSSFKEVVERKLIKRVSKAVHTHYTFEPKSYPSIYFNYEMDCIGLNGSLIGAKSLDFEQSIQSIDRNVSHYYTLISFLASKYEKPLIENKFFLISEEPDDIGSKKHQLWESVKKNELIKVLNPEESDIVARDIEQRKAVKFLNTN